VASAAAARSAVAAISSGVGSMPTTTASGAIPALANAPAIQPRSSATSGSIVIRGARSEKRGNTTATRPFSARARSGAPRPISVTARVAIAWASGRPSGSGAGGPPSRRGPRASRSRRTRSAAASPSARGSRPLR
jgi:hypothetical protein